MQHPPFLSPIHARITNQITPLSQGADCEWAWALKRRKKQRGGRRRADEWWSGRPRAERRDLSGRHRNSVCVGERRKRKVGDGWAACHHGLLCIPSLLTSLFLSFQLSLSLFSATCTLSPSIFSQLCFLFFLHTICSFVLFSSLVTSVSCLPICMKGTHMHEGLHTPPVVPLPSDG